MTAIPDCSRRTFLGRLLAGGGALAVGAALPRLLAEHPAVQRGRWRIGHHFWNWDHAWNKAEFLDRRLQLTKETGYAGWIMVERDSREPDYIQSARNMRAVLRRLGY